MITEILTAWCGKHLRLVGQWSDVAAAASQQDAHQRGGLRMETARLGGPRGLIHVVAATLALDLQSGLGQFFVVG
jgi:hypothetical protein